MTHHPLIHHHTMTNMTTAPKYAIIASSTRGGKAGRGHNATASIQVIQHGYLVSKSFRYRVADPKEKLDALTKARDWIAAEIAKTAP